MTDHILMLLPLFYFLFVLFCFNNRTGLVLLFWRRNRRTGIIIRDEWRSVKPYERKITCQLIHLWSNCRMNLRCSRSINHQGNLFLRDLREHMVKLRVRLWNMLSSYHQINYQMRIYHIVKVIQSLFV